MEAGTLCTRLRAISDCGLLVWHIVGGEDKGGVLVREGLELSSAKAPERLSKGALVQEVELLNERLHFRRMTGTGPDEGWISVCLDHKDLAERVLGPSVSIRPEQETLEDFEARRLAESWRRGQEEAERRRQQEREEQRKKEEERKDKKQDARKEKVEKLKQADLEWRVAEVRRIVVKAKEESCKTGSDRARPCRPAQRRAPARRGGRGRGGRSEIFLYDGAFLDEDEAEDSEDQSAPSLDGEWDCFCDMQKKGDLVKVVMNIEGSQGRYYIKSRQSRVNTLSAISLDLEAKPVTVSFRWNTWNGLNGHGTWRLSRSGDRIDGSWSQDHTDGGPWLWSGARADKRPFVSPLPMRAPFWYSIKVGGSGPRFQAQLRQAGLEVLPDPWGDEAAEHLLQARSLSKQLFPKRPFSLGDFGNGRQLALLISRGAACLTLGYCICAEMNGKELHVEQLGVSEVGPNGNVGLLNLGGLLLDWAVARADGLGCKAVKLKGSTSNVSFMELESFDLKVQAPLIVSCSDSILPSHLAVAGGIAELREGQDAQSPVLCYLPWGTPVEVVQGSVPVRRGHQDVVRVRWPVVGWMSADLLRPLETDEVLEEKAQTGARLLEAMATVRATVTGPDPFSMCFISSQALCDDLQERKLFPPGWCTVVFGNFLKSRDESAWWRHTWLRLGDGSIVDITADQFDEVPRLWWPADHTRYRPDPAR